MTTQEVHVRARAGDLGEGDKDGELRWARITLAQADLANIEVEIWGLRDLLSVLADAKDVDPKWASATGKMSSR